MRKWNELKGKKKEKEKAELRAVHGISWYVDPEFLFLESINLWFVPVDTNRKLLRTKYMKNNAFNMYDFNGNYENHLKYFLRGCSSRSPQGF